MNNTTLINLSSHNLIDTNVKFDNIQDYYEYVNLELIKKDFIDIIFYSSNYGSNYSFANINNRQDLERYFQLSYQINNQELSSFLGDKAINEDYQSIIKHKQSYHQSPQRFSNISPSNQDFFIEKVKHGITNVKDLDSLSYDYLYRVGFYITTSLFHNDINFVKAFTKQISFNSRQKSVYLIKCLETLHDLLDFNKGSLLFDTILNSVLAKQLTLSSENTLDTKSEQMFQFISKLSDDIQDTYYSNLLKKLNAKEQFLGNNIISNSLFPQRLYDTYNEKFKNISTQTAIDTLNDPSALKSKLAIVDTVTLTSHCFIPIAELHAFYKKIYTKKTFPIDHNSNVVIEHSFDSIDLKFDIKLDDLRTNLVINLHISAPSSKHDAMQPIQTYFNENIINFLDRSLLYHHKLLTQFNETYFFFYNLGRSRKSEHKNIKDLFVSFINEYRENALHDKFSQTNKGIDTSSQNKNKI